MKSGAGLAEVEIQELYFGSNSVFRNELLEANRSLQIVITRTSWLLHIRFVNAIQFHLRHFGTNRPIVWSEGCDSGVPKEKVRLLLVGVSTFDPSIIM